MEWLDVLQRIEAGEDWRTEFKRGLGDLSDIGKAICAFGNGDGGLIILGVDDAGAIVGVKVDEERVQERLTSFLQSGCSVPVSARCGRHEDPTGWVLWLHASARPHGGSVPENAFIFHTFLHFLCVFVRYSIVTAIAVSTDRHT